MKYIIKIDYFENFYFYLCTLALPISPSQKIYQKSWLNDIKPLTNSQKFTLEKFKELLIKNKLLKYQFKAYYNYINHAVSCDVTSKKNQIIFNKIFTSWNNNFSNFYKNEFPLLNQWKKLLNNQFKNDKLIQLILETLAILYNTPIKNPAVNIFLLPSVKNYSSGAAIKIDKKSPIIQLNISHYPLNDKTHPLGILFHELIHAYYENPYFVNLIKKNFTQIDKINYLKEITASSLFPNGTMAEKYLNIQTKKLRINLSQKYTRPLLTLAREYLAEKKPFDSRYINKLYKIIYSKKGK